MYTCKFAESCMLLSHFNHVRLCATPWTAAHQAPRPWDSPGKNTGVGSHRLFQGIFPTQESNPGLLHCRWILYHLTYQENPIILILGIIVYVACFYFLICGGSEVKASTSNVGDSGSMPGSGNPLEKGIATHSSILAWRIPWTEEPGGLQSTGSQRVGHNWATSLHFELPISSYGLESHCYWLLYICRAEVPWTLQPLKAPSGMQCTALVERTLFPIILCPHLLFLLPLERSLCGPHSVVSLGY